MDEKFNVGLQPEPPEQRSDVLVEISEVVFWLWRLEERPKTLEKVHTFLVNPVLSPENHKKTQNVSFPECSGIINESTDT